MRTFLEADTVLIWFHGKALLKHIYFVRNYFTFFLSRWSLNGCNRCGIFFKDFNLKKCATSLFINRGFSSGRPSFPQGDISDLIFWQRPLKTHWFCGKFSHFIWRIELENGCNSFRIFFEDSFFWDRFCRFSLWIKTTLHVGLDFHRVIFLISFHGNDLSNTLIWCKFLSHLIRTVDLQNRCHRFCIFLKNSGTKYRTCFALFQQLLFLR